MEYIATESDRRDCRRYAWQVVKLVNAPRSVRLLLRDQLADIVLTRVIAERRGELPIKLSNET